MQLILKEVRLSHNTNNGKISVDAVEGNIILIARFEITPVNVTGQKKEYMVIIMKQEKEEEWTITNVMDYQQSDDTWGHAQVGKGVTEAFIKLILKEPTVKKFLNYERPIVKSHAPFY